MTGDRFDGHQSNRLFKPLLYASTLAMPDRAGFSMGDDSAAKPNDPEPTREEAPLTVGFDRAETSDAKTVSPKAPTSIWRCLSGSAIAAALGYGAYKLTFSIATQFATHPLVSDNYIAIRLSGMVRTLVVGIASMATGIFAFAALGLAVLGLQITLQKFKPGSSTSS